MKTNKSIWSVLILVMSCLMVYLICRVYEIYTKTEPFLYSDKVNHKIICPYESGEEYVKCTIGSIEKGRFDICFMDRDTKSKICVPGNICRIEYDNEECK